VPATRPSLRVCAKPGCPRLSGESMCDEHRREAVRTRQARRPRPRGNDPRTIKAVLGRDGWCCVLCGAKKRDPSRRKPGTTVRLEVAHIVAHADGGSNDLSNLRTLCTDCHHQEHHG
jgi:5-methylcytosine-specific restriction endonuclease McrA